MLAGTTRHVSRAPVWIKPHVNSTKSLELRVAQSLCDRVRCLMQAANTNARPQPGRCVVDNERPDVKRTLLALFAAAAVPMLTACPGGDITPGSACSQEGATHKNSTGYTYTCRQVPGGNRIWQQDQPLTPDRP